MATGYLYSDYSFKSDDEENDVVERSYRRKKKINKGRWTKEEDEKLKTLAGDYGPSDWKELAAKFPDRTDTQCQQRWHKVLNPELIKGPWTKEEDEKVVELVHKYGPKKWSLIAQHLKGRIGKQCRERWHNHLNPNIKKSAWTEEEDRLIYEAHKKMGNKWAEIAKVIPGRTDNAIKNHWNSTMRRRVESFGYDHYKKNRYAGEKGRHGRPSSTKKERRRREDFDDDGINNQVSVPMAMPTTRTVVLEHGKYSRGPTQVSNLGSSSLTSIRPRSQVNQYHVSKSSKGDPTSETSPFRSYILSQSLLDSDPSTWGDLSTFENGTGPSKGHASTKLTSPGTRGYRFDGSTLAGLQSDGSLIPITSPVLQTRFSTPPTILRRAKKRKAPEENDSSASLSTIIHQERSDSIFSSPKTCTPIKSLPFSPSQFLNSPGSKRRTSTPSEQKTTSTSTTVNATLNTPTLTDTNNNNSEEDYRTPRIRRTLLHMSPRTPTPFKNALKILNETKMAHTPAHFDEDFSEIIKKEAEESGVDISCSVAKEPVRKARASLCKRMEDNMELVTPALFNCSNEEPSVKVEKSIMAPSTSLSKPDGLDDSGIAQTSSLLLSPTQDIIKPAEIFGKQDLFVTPSTNLNHELSKNKRKNNLMRPLQFQETPRKIQNINMDTTWEQVACGKTPDQQFVTEQAKNFIASYRPAARTLHFNAPTMA
ncbi:myb-related protein B isoform X2 [Exaiptasia diaphana]|uniref:Uncharacterized protein n=1 Tax=Exaiptasia diaphana TaxID=2652724 RepID=A0A913XXD9_EXADI|nr:myb-related protein B isoform X2 [Exaiptasia diaphana]KXJ08016.1 Myb-related protein B [Exaiptasia diaphana]